MADAAVVASLTAAGAALVSAGVVAWQAWETRRAANAAAASLELTRSAQVASERSVNAATALALEAAHSRRDARAPRIELRLEGNPVWPPLEESDYGQPQPVQPRATFRVPRDGERRLLVRQALRVVNHEPYAVRIQASQMVRADLQAWPESELSIPANGFVELLCQESRSVLSWIEIATERAAGGAGAEVAGMVWHSDSYDDGVIDYWEVRIGGSPLVSVADDAAGWMVVADWIGGAPAPLASVLMPRRRRYFLSKAESRELELGD